MFFKVKMFRFKVDILSVFFQYGQIYQNNVWMRYWDYEIKRIFVLQMSFDLPFRMPLTTKWILYMPFHLG